jgi:predicted short-subunit dehydrogenase-like oxidoreductase (DUF2520 family)
MAACGYRPAGLASRTLASARRLAERLQPVPTSTNPWEVTREADLVFVTTPDDAIAEAAADLARKQALGSGAVVLHCSGAHASTILEPAAGAGAYIGSLHPLQSFASKEFAHNPFEGIIAAVEGQPAAVAVARRVAADLGASPLEIPTEAKVLYHAAAVAASNYLVALFDLAFRLLSFANLSGPQAWEVLKPLVDGTLANIGRVGIPEALTGPIARGDVATVAAHVAAIAARAPELLELYLTLGRQTIEVARDKGTLTETVAGQLQALLAAGASSNESS